MTQAIHEQPRLGQRRPLHRRRGKLASLILRLQPEDSLLLNDLQAVRRGDTLQQWKNVRLCNRLMETERRASRRNVPIRHVETSDLGERGDHRSEIDVLKIDENARDSLSHRPAILATCRSNRGDDGYREPGGGATDAHAPARGT